MTDTKRLRELSEAVAVSADALEGGDFSDYKELAELGKKAADEIERLGTSEQLLKLELIDALGVIRDWYQFDHTALNSRGEDAVKRIAQLHVDLGVPE